MDLLRHKMQQNAFVSICFKVRSKYLFYVNRKHLLETVTTKVTSSDFHVRAPNENSHIRKQGCELTKEVQRQTKFVFKKS